MARTMSTAEIAAKAEANLRKMSGYRYSAAQIAAKAEAGLIEGDVIQAGAVRLVYLGGSQVRRERQGDQGTWQVEATIEATDTQLDGLLIQAAAEAGKVSTHMGDY